MECPKGSTVLGLPDDPAVEILSRVPAGRLRQLKRVSRSWRDLIADPLHRKRLLQTLEGFFYGNGGGDNYGRFTSLFGSSVPTDIDPSFSFLKKLPGIEIERMVLLDSCNELLLFLYTQDSDSFGYLVCNPATKESVPVPVPSPTNSPLPTQVEGRDFEKGRYTCTFLMFDPAVSSHFRLVQFWQDGLVVDIEGVHTYSSETRGCSDRSSEWKRGEKGGEWGQWGEALVKPTFGRAFVNGLLHFLVYHFPRNQALIVAIDGEGKTCRIISCDKKCIYSTVCFIGQSQGHLHCISLNRRLKDRHLRTDKVLVWVLKDYGTQEWILKQSMSCSDVFGKVDCSMWDFSIIAVHPDRNVVFFVQAWNKKLVAYDMDSRKLHAFHTLEHKYRSVRACLAWLPSPKL